MMKYQAIVLAAGSGSRSALPYNKVLFRKENKTLIEQALANFLEDIDCLKVVVVIQPCDESKIKEILKNDKLVYTYGGSTRQESVKNGLSLIDSEYVIVHDGARPYYSKQLLETLKEQLMMHNCVIPVIELSDSIKKVKDHFVVCSLNRSEYRLIQSPQGFKTADIKLAHQKANHYGYTDDSAMIEELLNQEVYCVAGEKTNIKFTYKEDF